MLKITFINKKIKLNTNKEKNLIYSFPKKTFWTLGNVAYPSVAMTTDDVVGVGVVAGHYQTVWLRRGTNHVSAFRQNWVRASNG